MANIYEFPTSDDHKERLSKRPPFRAEGAIDLGDDGYHHSPEGMTDGMQLLDYFEARVALDGFSAEGWKAWIDVAEELKNQRHKIEQSQANTEIGGI